MADFRIWDLRRGDYDDNRLSPHGGGLRSVILSSLLEFNYLKAPLSFLTLVIVPAVLVGIAPSIVATYGLLIRQTATQARTSVMIALFFAAILIAAALLIGRPLVIFIFDNLQHLRYLLVFPIFVALREVLRAGAERMAGESITPAQLNSMRRAATVLATLVFASAGLALAFAVEFSIGLKLINVERVSVWTAVMAALGNAAVVLGVSTVFESLYWFWREIRLNSPVLDWVPNPTPVAASQSRVAHLSDLHLVGERYGFRMETGAYGPRGNHYIRNALRKLAAIQTRAPVDRVLISGDVTDAGTRAEWAAFMDLVRSCPILRERLSFVPGNHDVNIVDRTNPGRLDLPWSAGMSLRKLRVVLALDAVQGDRAHVIDRRSGNLGPLLKDYLREGNRLERLRTLAQSGSIRGRWEMMKVWDAIFPLVEPAPREDSYGLILLDSNAPSHIALTNAIGVVNPTQLRALKSVLRNSPGRAWIVLLHHQVVEYPVASTSLKDRIGLALVNAPEVLATIAPHASRVLILHGHRHIDWIGTYGNVVLCSAPSTTLSDVEKHRGSFHIHNIALGDEGRLRLTSTERLQVA